MAENLPNLEKETDAQVQDPEDAKQDESKQTHTKIHQKLKIKRGFYRQQEKKSHLQGNSHRLLVDFIFLSEAL